MAEEKNVRTGTVKWFDPRKGYGFVTDEETGEDHFCHFTGISEGRHYTGFEDGDKVSFEVSEGKKGPQATSVKLLEQAKPARKEKPADKAQ